MIQREETGNQPLKPTIKALGEMKTVGFLSLVGFMYSVEFCVLVWFLL